MVVVCGQFWVEVGSSSVFSGPSWRCWGSKTLRGKKRNKNLSFPGENRGLAMFRDDSWKPHVLDVRRGLQWPGLESAWPPEFGGDPSSIHPVTYLPNRAVGQ